MPATDQTLPPPLHVAPGSPFADRAAADSDFVILTPLAPERQYGPISLHAGILLACAAVLALAAVLEVRSETEVWFLGHKLPESCSWRRIYGINCLGCGLTRSFVSLAHFDPLRAWHFNPAGPALFAGLLFQLPYRGGQLWQIARRRPVWQAPIRLFLVWIVLSVVLLLVQWLVRVAWPMLPGS